MAVECYQLDITCIDRVYSIDEVMTFHFSPQIVAEALPCIIILVERVAPFVIVKYHVLAVAIEVLLNLYEQLALDFPPWRCLMRPVQVGIKYGGKGEVDVTGLEMELREPYKV